MKTILLSILVAFTGLTATAQNITVSAGRAYLGSNYIGSVSDAKFNNPDLADAISAANVSDLQARHAKWEAARAAKLAKWQAARAKEIAAFNTPVTNCVRLARTNYSTAFIKGLRVSVPHRQFYFQTNIAPFNVKVKVRPVQPSP